MYRTKALIFSSIDPPATLLKVIRKNGLNMRVVKNMKLAFELIHKKVYRLIFIDITGITIDLTETIEQIVKIKSDIVIIGIIPRNKGILSTKLINNGMFDILQKPLNPVTVEASLKRAIYVVKLHREINQNGHEMNNKDADIQIADMDIENLGLDELIKKKLAILFSKHTHKKIVNLYSIVMPIIEKSFIETALKLSNNNQVKASLLLGINRNTLKAKMMKLSVKKQ